MTYNILLASEGVANESELKKVLLDVMTLIKKKNKSCQIL